MSDTCVIEEWRIYRNNVETEIGRVLTDEEWDEFASEIKGRIENYENALYEDLIDQLGKGVFKSKHIDKEIW